MPRWRRYPSHCLTWVIRPPAGVPQTQQARWPRCDGLTVRRTVVPRELGVLPGPRRPNRFGRIESTIDAKAGEQAWLITEVVACQAQSAIKLNLGSPIEVLGSFRAIESDLVDVPVAFRCMARLLLVTSHALKELEDLVDRDLHSGADVVNLPGPTVEHGQVGGRRVRYVEQVTRLLTVPIDTNRQAQ